MQSVKIDRLNGELKRLETLGGLIGTAIVKRNGLLVTCRLPRDIEERNLGAMAASMFESVEAAAKAIQSKQVYNITVRFNDCQLIAIEAGKDAMIVALVELNTNFGLFCIELEEIAKKIKRIMKVE